MPTYVEKYCRYGDADEPVVDIYEVVDQPRRYRYASLALSWFGLKFDKLVHAAEPTALWLHQKRRKCRNDCGQMTPIVDGVEQAPQPACIYLGLCAELDLKVYNLSRRDAQVLARAEGVQDAQ